MDISDIILVIWVEICIFLVAGNVIQFLYFRWQKNKAIKLQQALDQAIRIAQKHAKENKKRKSGKKSKKAGPQQAARQESIRLYIDYLKEELSKVQASKDKFSVSNDYTNLEGDEKPEELALIMRECFLKAEIDALHYPSDSHNYWNSLRNSLVNLFDTIRLSMDTEEFQEGANGNSNDPASNQGVDLGALQKKLDHYRGRINTLEGFRSLFIEMETKYNQLSERYQEELQKSVAKTKTPMPVVSHVTQKSDTLNDQLKEAEHQQQITIYKRRIDELRQKQLDSDNRINEMRNSLEKAMKENRHLKQKTAVLEQDNEDLDFLRETIRENAENSQQMLIAIEMLEKENEEIRAESQKTLKDWKKQAQSAYDSYERTIAEKDAKISMLEKEFVSLESQLLSLAKNRNN